MATVIGPGMIIQDGQGGGLVITEDANGRKFRSVRITEETPLHFFQAKNGDVWELRRDGKADHPTQKPVELARRGILNSTQEGDIVFDPFLGSGTTLMAAEVTGRAAYGTEIDRNYCDVIIRRWEKLTGKKAKKV